MAPGRRKKEQHAEDALNNVYEESSLRSHHKRRKLHKIPLGRTQQEAPQHHFQSTSFHTPDGQWTGDFDQDMQDSVHHELGRLPVRSNCRDHILKIITERDAPPMDAVCRTCKSVKTTNPMQWRCHFCFGDPVYCSECIRRSHQNLPFHMVSRWDGNAFHRSSLSKAGVTLNLGHCGDLCPAYLHPNSLSASAPDVESDPMDVDPTSTPSISPEIPGHPCSNIDSFLDIDSDDEDSWRDPTTGGIPLRAKKPD
ncbi:hypothetical protein QCA50_016415 [Cerrena zonata]|uniref:ZZ-type domain-containing protein n=1 Tax=Cerrena zonata TaxID=2478898 RepID=A0AAW0FFX4_9APHY